MLDQTTIELWYAHGLTPLPIYGLSSDPDENKRPNFQWRPWIEKRPSLPEVIAQFDKNRGQKVGLVTGKVELLDIDIKHDLEGKVWVPFDQKFKSLYPELYSKMVIESTQGGGTHYWYKVPDDCIAPSMHLAVIPKTPAEIAEKPKERKYWVVIETRGEGGQGNCSPSAGYNLIQNEIHQIQEITSDERQLIWNLAFDCSITPSEEVVIDKGKPGAHYDETATFEDLDAMLRHEGWKPLRSSGRSGWKNYSRPGAKHPNNVDGGLNRETRFFYNLSSGASLPTNKGLSPFALYAHLYHNADFKAAARDLASKGYGKETVQAGVLQRPVAPGTGEEQTEPDYVFRLDEDTQESLIEKLTNKDFDALLKSARFDVKKPRDTKYQSWVNVRTGALTQRTGLSFKKALVPIFGAQKSRKTTLLTSIVAAALRGTVLNFEWDEDPGLVLWIDTEQADADFTKTINRIYIAAGKDGRTENLHAYQVYQMSTKERIRFIDRAVQTLKPGVLVIDGVRDLLLDFNDMKQATFVMNCIAKWQSMGCTVFAVLHLNKGDKTPRGHLGNGLLDKCTSSISVTAIDDFIMEIAPYLSRGARFEPFTLRAGRYNMLYDHNLSSDFPCYYNFDVLNLQEENSSDSFQMPNNRDEDVPF